MKILDLFTTNKPCRLLVNLEPTTKRNKASHEPHPLERPLVREPGPVRVAGISTTVMDAGNPRYSTSDALLSTAIDHAREALGAETRLIRLNALSFRACEGYYSKSASACTWPCSITQMDAKDKMDRVYDALVFWADAVILATPIRWGSAQQMDLCTKMIRKPVLDATRFDLVWKESVYSLKDAYEMKP